MINNVSMIDGNQHSPISYRSKVSIVRCNDYIYEDVYTAVKKSLDLIGGLDNIIKPSHKVFVKINHLPPASLPEKGIITHPIFLKAVIEHLKMTGAYITVGDDIGSEPIGHRDKKGVDGFRVSGIRQTCEESQVELINLRNAGFVEVNCQGTLLKKLYVSRMARDADVIVNLPKLKTHSFTVYTGGIKNMFGTIPKGKRIQYHYDYRKHREFHHMLVDVFSTVRPQLSIMDSIIAMEGDGPSLGDLRRLGIVLASQDTVALDSVVLDIIGLDARNFDTTKYAYQHGLGNIELQQIDILGEKIDEVAVPDFKLPVTRTGMRRSKAPAFISRFLKRQSLIKPKIVSNLCVGCQECKKTCPANAISIVNDKACVDKHKCISCFCCHEVCRYNAVTLKRPFIRSFINSITQTLRNHGMWS